MNVFSKSGKNIRKMYLPHINEMLIHRDYTLLTLVRQRDAPNENLIKFTLLIYIIRLRAQRVLK